MPNRFIFRQVQAADFQTFLADGEIRAKNHAQPQLCHQASYENIVQWRGMNHFILPYGGVVNDYVQFYFSPLTGFTYTIHRGNVPLKCPAGNNLGVACSDDRIFFVLRVADVASSGVQFCYSDYPLNSMAPMPTLETDPCRLEEHVHWNVFDEEPLRGDITEIGYGGVCAYFKNVDYPPERQTRKEKRMAEFLIKSSVSLNLVSCIITKSNALRGELQTIMDTSRWRIPIVAKPGCYF